MLDYVPGLTAVHRADVRAKAFVFCVLTLFLFLFKSPVYNFGLALFATLLTAYVRIPIVKIWGLLSPLVPVLLLILLFSVFAAGGVGFGITLMLRIYAMVILTMILTSTTPLDHFVHLMHLIKVPQPLTFVVVTAVRFIPAMRTKAERVFDAQKARGAKLSGGRVFGKLIAFMPIMVPLLVDSLRMSEQLAVAMLNRGYGAVDKPTPLRSLRMTPQDYLLCTTAAAVLTLFLYLKWTGHGNR